MSRRNKPEIFVKPAREAILRWFLAFLLLPCALSSNVLAQTYSLIYAFSGGTDGAGPQGQMVIDASANLLGETNRGGDLASCSGGCGVIFRLTPTGILTVLHTFRGQDGWAPSRNMVLGPSNELYGTTGLGGGLGWGNVFKLNTVTGRFVVLHTFTGGADGGQPFGLIRDAAGNLYGTTFSGGILGCGDNGTCGTIYKLDTRGKQSVLYSFTGGSDGSLPISVIRDNAGNLYGMTLAGGDPQCSPGSVFGGGCGTVFELTSGGVLKVLHTFTGGSDGENSSAVTGSNASLIRDSAGNLFGTSPSGGLQDCPAYPGCGVIFRLSARGKELVLHSFTGGADGATPSYTLNADGSGNLYGTTTLGGFIGGACFPAGCGTVFRLDRTGHLTTLYSFTDELDGYYPTDLIRDQSGNLWGETVGGGGNLGSAGTIFKITP
jgi:uncharacterized repeat protein (TIGR03803 family)